MISTPIGNVDPLGGFVGEGGLSSMTVGAAQTFYDGNSKYRNVYGIGVEPFLGRAHEGDFLERQQEQRDMRGYAKTTAIRQARYYKEWLGDDAIPSSLLRQHLLTGVADMVSTRRHDVMHARGSGVVPLWHAGHRYLAHLAGGQLQRVALTRIRHTSDARFWADGSYHEVAGTDGGGGREKARHFTVDPGLGSLAGIQVVGYSDFGSRSHLLAYGETAVVHLRSDHAGYSAANAVPGGGALLDPIAKWVLPSKPVAVASSGTGANAFPSALIITVNGAMASFDAVRGCTWLGEVRGVTPSDFDGVDCADAFLGARACSCGTDGSTFWVSHKGTLSTLDMRVKRCVPLCSVGMPIWGLLGPLYSSSGSSTTAVNASSGFMSSYNAVCLVDGVGLLYDVRYPSAPVSQTQMPRGERHGFATVLSPVHDGSEMGDNRVAFTAGPSVRQVCLHSFSTTLTSDSCGSTARQGRWGFGPGLHAALPGAASMTSPKWSVSSTPVIDRGRHAYMLGCCAIGFHEPSPYLPTAVDGEEPFDESHAAAVLWDGLIIQQNHLGDLHAQPWALRKAGADGGEGGGGHLTRSHTATLWEEIADPQPTVALDLPCGHVYGPRPSVEGLIEWVPGRLGETRRLHGPQFVLPQPASSHLPVVPEDTLRRYHVVLLDLARFHGGRAGRYEHFLRTGGFWSSAGTSSVTRKVSVVPLEDLQEHAPGGSGGRRPCAISVQQWADSLQLEEIFRFVLGLKDNQSSQAQEGMEIDGYERRELSLETLQRYAQLAVVSPQVKNGKEGETVQTQTHFSQLSQQSQWSVEDTTLSRPSQGKRSVPRSSTSRQVRPASSTVLPSSAVTLAELYTIAHTRAVDVALAATPHAPAAVPVASIRQLRDVVRSMKDVTETISFAAQPCALEPGTGQHMLWPGRSDGLRVLTQVLGGDGDEKEPMPRASATQSEATLPRRGVPERIVGKGKSEGRSKRSRRKGRKGEEVAEEKDHEASANAKREIRNQQINSARVLRARTTRADAVRVGHTALVGEPCRCTTQLLVGGTGAGADVEVVLCSDRRCLIPHLLMYTHSCALPHRLEGQPNATTSPTAMHLLGNSQPHMSQMSQASAVSAVSALSMGSADTDMLTRLRECW